MKARLCMAITCVSAIAQPVAANEFSFVPRVTTAGIVHEYSGGWEHFVGGGMATFDCNADDFPDVYLAGGEKPSALLINTTKKPGAPVSFSAVERADGVYMGVTGAYPLDIDSDGILDLFVMRVGENKLLRGLGNCAFEEANETWNFEGGNRWTTSFAATWEGDSAWPMLVAGNYVDREDPEGPFGTCDDNVLHRPDADGYGDAQLLTPGYCALSMLISDWRRNGLQDLRISNDRHYYVDEGQEQMYSLSADRFLGPDDGWQKVKLWGMGIASQDLNLDGKPDVMLTSMGDQLLQFYDKDGQFTNAPFSLGSYAHRPYTGDDGRPSTGWHAEFGDINNDALPDIFIAKGNVDQMPGLATKDPNNLLVQQPDGSFIEAGLEAGIADMARSRGGVVADFNLDGRLDIGVMNRRAPFEIYENRTENTGNYISVRLTQPGPNTRAVGAWIELRIPDGKPAQAREVTVGGGHASGESGPLHFGLSTYDQAEIRVIWPNGEISNWLTIDANQLIEISPKADGNLLTAKLVGY